MVVDEDDDPLENLRPILGKILESELGPNYHGRFILGGADGHTTVPCPNLLQWAKWFETADRTVARTTVRKLEVSTVFIGLDMNHHRWFFGGKMLPPTLFETMIFRADRKTWKGFYQERCSTWDEAVKMHAKAVRFLRRKKLRKVS